jgi:tetratricopeptide (TPR) repeat protein
VFLAIQRMISERTKLGRLEGSNVLPIAEKMLEGEILFREGKTDDSIAALREAVRREDGLPYHEPPYWILHVRHGLGAALIDLGRLEQAESVYREDLARHPENGWSLYGLARSLRKRGKNTEASAVSARFRKAWQNADFQISSSCCCLPLRDDPGEDEARGTLSPERSERAPRRS